MKKIIVLICMIFSLNACEQVKETKPVKVQHVGALKEIMHEGKYESRITLRDLPQAHLYGLGAVSELQGEILILDGKPLISQVKNTEAAVWEEVNATATLLVYAQVPEWDTLQIDQVEEVETLVAQKLKERKINAPTPFRIVGKAASLTYHIINFDLEKGDLMKHKEGAFKETLKDIEMEILGFYATAAKGIYTHHDSNVHLHFKTKNGDKMGHVEQVTFGKPAVQLLLPKL